MRALISGHLNQFVRALLAGLMILIAQGSVSCQASENTILFKIQWPASNNVSYLFGFYGHFGKSFFDTLNTTMGKLEAAEVLLLEMTSAVPNQSTDNDDRKDKEINWSKYLNKPDLDYVKSLFINDEYDLTKFSPKELDVFLHAYHSSQICQVRIRQVHEISIGKYAYNLANQTAKKLIGLERTKGHATNNMKPISNMSRREIKKRLTMGVHLIREKRRIRSCDILIRYATLEYAHLFDEECVDSSELNEQNREWMKVIPGYLKDSNCFVLVGPVHIGNKCGLIPQLMEMGFVVTPMNPN